MAGPSRTCCVSEYCTGVLLNRHPWRFHYPRPISIPFTKSAEEPTDGVHLRRLAIPGGGVEEGGTLGQYRIEMGVARFG